MTAPLRKGQRWNESSTTRDAVSQRPLRRLTSAGLWNALPTYHTGSAFSADSRRAVLVTKREGGRSLCAVDLTSGDLTCLTDPIDDPVLEGVSIGLAPSTGWVLYRTTQGMHMVHLDTLQAQRVPGSSEPGERCSTPAISHDGAKVAFTCTPRLPPAQAHLKEPDTFAWWAAHGKPYLRIVEVDLASGSARQITRIEGVLGNHVQYRPGDPTTLMIDVDTPPLFAWGCGGAAPRVQLLNTATGALNPCPSRCGKPFQVHSTWTHDGSGIVYHGWIRPGNNDGWYVSALDAQGRVLREYVFDQAKHYGHVAAAMPGEAAIILDGNLTSDLLLLCRHHDAERPQIEVLGRHGTDWTTLPGQLTHPHPQVSADGRWLVYNRAEAGRADCFAMEL